MLYMYRSPSSVSPTGPHGRGRPGRLAADHPHETGVCVLKLQNPAATC